MNLSQSKKDDYKKIYIEAKPNLLKLAKKLYIDDISDNFFLEIVIPLSVYLNSFQKRDIPYFIGLTGGQGSGETTLSIFIQKILIDVFKKRAVGFSIDDIYKTKEDREKVAIQRDEQKVDMDTLIEEQVKTRKGVKWVAR